MLCRLDMAEVERLRRAIPLSKAALCAKARIGYSTYKYAQTGRRVRQLVADKLAKTLDVPVEQIATPANDDADHPTAQAS